MRTVQCTAVTRAGLIDTGSFHLHPRLLLALTCLRDGPGGALRAPDVQDWPGSLPWQHSGVFRVVVVIYG